MAYVITDNCIACGSCKDECPVEAISEGSDQYNINPFFVWIAVPVRIIVL